MKVRIAVRRWVWIGLAIVGSVASGRAASAALPSTAANTLRAHRRPDRPRTVAPRKGRTHPAGRRVAALSAAAARAGGSGTHRPGACNGRSTRLVRRRRSGSGRTFRSRLRDLFPDRASAFRGTPARAPVLDPRERLQAVGGRCARGPRRNRGDDGSGGDPRAPPSDRTPPGLEHPRQLELVLQVSNFHYVRGGPLEPISIGTPAAAHAARESRLALRALPCRGLRHHRALPRDPLGERGGRIRRSSTSLSSALAWPCADSPWRRSTSSTSFQAPRGRP